MRLTVLGCRSGMPADGQGSSCYLVETTGAKVLLDCGPSAAVALSTFVHPRELDAVVISHLHSDHCYDLLPIGKALLASQARGQLANQFPSLPERANPDPGPAPAPVPLYVPRGGRKVLQTLASLFPVTTIPLLDQAFERGFDVREYDPGASFSVGDVTVEMHGLRHAVPNCGTRLVSPGGSLAYTGDTGFTDALAPFAQDVDLLLSEATLERSDTTEHGHLSAAEAAAVAVDANVGQLVLTHFVTADQAWIGARRAEAEQIFDGPVHVAAPRRQFAARQAVPPTADAAV